MMPLLTRVMSTSRLLGLQVGLIFVVAGSAGHIAAATAVKPGAPVRRPFAAASFWNTRLPATVPPSNDSVRLVKALNTQVERFGATICTTAYSTPVYRVGTRVRSIRVRLDRTIYPGTSPYALARAFARVPIPHGARPAEGTDGHLVIWQRSTDTMWEFWRARLVGGHWHAEWGGRMRHVSSNPGYFTGRFTDWGATATGLPLIGGLIMERELQVGRIRHALAMSVPAVQAGSPVWPAQRSDGRSHALYAIPEGTRFRIRPDVDLASLHLSAPALAIARAAQSYGMIVRDGGGSVGFYAEAPKNGQRNPYDRASGPFAGLKPWEILSKFPWKDLEAVPPPVS